ncbi:MAG: tripartite tricarboxylate transporter substrate binding protein [Comamonadaceae bacterium]|nr:MAG: tripartite tricarboxylate transporter substrate binding protein [Comamonadaceae bacterium]
MERRKVLKFAASAAAALSVPLARAQAHWKASRPIQLMVPGQAGGMSDILARQVANAIGASLGQPIVIDNRPGASGTLASILLTKGQADGHSLLTASSDTHTVYPHFFNNPSFQPEGHVPVAIISFVPFGLAVRKDLPVSNLAEFIALAKSRQLSFSTWGVGTTGHASMLLMARAAGIKDMLHVPFTGSAPAIQALMAGQVDAMMGAIPLIASSRSHIKPLAVMSRSRSPAMSDVPTLQESGVSIEETKGFWVGIVAPPKTPADTVQVLAAEIRKAVESPSVKGRIAELGAVPDFVGPEGFQEVIRKEYDQWKRLTQEAGIARVEVK